MRNPPRGNGGQPKEIRNSIASTEPCPIPCLYVDLHEEHCNAAGYITGTSCTLCGQTITRAEWRTELLRAAFDALPPFPGAGERL
jgi:hypothetical protein